MIQAIAYTVVAVLLYAVSDRLLNQIEIKRGKRLEHRSLVFFAIILALALGAFSLLESLT